nr:immunoglobulin light chain junction region [Mus musculus]
CLQYDGFPWTF